MRSALLAWIGTAGARIGTVLAVNLAALLLALAGLAFLFAALFLWLTSVMDPALAALVTGLVVLAIAGIVALISRTVVMLRRATPVAPIARAVQSDVAALAGSELGSAGSAWLRAHLPQVALAAAGAGFALGVSPRLRAALWRQLR